MPVTITHHTHPDLDRRCFVVAILAEGASAGSMDVAFGQIGFDPVTENLTAAQIKAAIQPLAEADYARRTAARVTPKKNGALATLIAEKETREAARRTAAEE